MRKAKSPVPVRALRTQSKTQGVGKIISVQTARVLERRYKVMAMRKDGIPLRDIANTLKCDIQTVRADLTEVLGQAATKLQETTEEARNLEVERLDALIRRYQPLAEAGNLAACSMVLGISDRRRKLLSLDIPEIKQTDETAVRVYVGIDIDGV